MTYIRPTASGVMGALRFQLSEIHGWDSNWKKLSSAHYEGRNVVVATVSSVDTSRDILVECIADAMDELSAASIADRKREGQIVYWLAGVTISAEIAPGVIRFTVEGPENLVERDSSGQRNDSTTGL